jgi:VIT1/CCC1 family predicted Fe2+/Mn2+ transporter
MVTAGLRQAPEVLVVEQREATDNLRTRTHRAVEEIALSAEGQIQPVLLGQAVEATALLATPQGLLQIITVAALVVPVLPAVALEAVVLQAVASVAVVLLAVAVVTLAEVEDNKRILNII